MLLPPSFRYNPRHPRREGFHLVDLEQARGIERRKRARGEEHTCDFFSRVFARRYFRGGYVDDANPSASEQQAARAMVPVWHSMRAGSKARDLGDRSVGVVGRVGGGAIRESAEWQRF